MTPVEKISALHAATRTGHRISVLTAYDYPMARLLDEAGLDILLVGDSLGMVVLGYPDTTLVTLEEMAHHTRAVARGAMAATQRALIVSDLPYHTYETPAQAITSARMLIEAGAEAVKIEGGVEKRDILAALVDAGVQVMGHIGMLPQHVREEGGYHLKGKTAEQAAALLADGIAVQEAGAFAVVLEIVHAPTAKQISEALAIPTIGIGSGLDCDGQVLVTHDLVGAFPWFTPKFAKPVSDVAGEYRKAASTWLSKLRADETQP